MELTLEDIIEQVYASKDVEMTILARKIKQEWDQGVIPSRKNINTLLKFLEPATTCARLSDDGICMGWLKRNQAELTFPVSPPYLCPFVAQGNKEATYKDCPGYRKT